MNEQKHIHPHYWPPDSLYELAKEESMFYLQLSNGNFEGLLSRTVSSGKEYRKFLKLYPEVMCEPLERYYLLRRATGKLDVHMVQDLLFTGSWREANWGTWLAAIAPQPEYIELLEKRRLTLPHGTKLIDLAIASCAAELPQHLESHLQLLQSIQEMLNKLPEIKTPMRLWLHDQKSYASEIETARSLLHNGNIKAGLELTKKGLLGYYGQSYKSWLNSGAPLAPENSKFKASLLPAGTFEKSGTHKPWWKLW